MTEQDEAQHVVWRIEVKVECQTTASGARPMKRFERATYIVDREAALSEMMRWVERTERAKYDVLGWPVLTLDMGITIEL